ncbi:MAG: hypothetical protein IRZ15_12550, partial [Bryobacteraceae bacterium]|nr:hypothetical protein [Bryobacteraceae bacterium]
MANGHSGLQDEPLPEQAQAAAPIRVLIADDHPIVRDGLKKLLALEEDLVVVGE